MDCEVLEAKNGKGAVLCILKEKPDCVFLDIVMPEVGGVEALKIIREAAPNLPVIMLSSEGTPAKLMATLKLGAIDFIQKPYTSEQVGRALDAVRKRGKNHAGI